MPAVVAVLAVIEGADLPEDVLALIAHHHLDLGGTYGDPNAGDPIRYDELCIERNILPVVENDPVLDDDAVETTPRPLPAQTPLRAGCVRFDPSRGIHRG